MRTSIAGLLLCLSLSVFGTQIAAWAYLSPTIVAEYIYYRILPGYPGWVAIDNRFAHKIQEFSFTRQIHTLSGELHLRNHVGHLLFDLRIPHLNHVEPPYLFQLTVRPWGNETAQTIREARMITERALNEARIHHSGFSPVEDSKSQVRIYLQDSADFQVFMKEIDRISDRILTEGYDFLW